VTPYYDDDWLTVYSGDCRAVLAELADESVHCVVTSPPYWGLRDYGHGDQLGLEPTPEAYVANMVAVFREVKRVLRPDGTCWLNLGDSYAANRGYQVPDNKWSDVGNNHGMNVPEGLKPKDLIGIPWMVAFALRADGWWLRSDIIWHKPNPMPESVTDRPTKAHEYMFLLTKSANYFYDQDATREPITQSTIERGQYGWNGKSGDAPEVGARSGSNFHRLKDGGITMADVGMANPAGRNRRTVWTIATESYSGAHFATYPRALVEPCVKAGTSERGCCPKCGAPWERVTEKPEGYPTGSYHDHKMDGVGYGLRQNGKGPKNLPLGMQAYTTGWRPTCKCGIETTVPATVFDPFAGSGTTLLVARQLGRNGVGLDLSMPYLRDQARDRLGLIALDEWTNGKRNGKSGELEGLPMFEQVLK